MDSERNWLALYRLGAAAAAIAVAALMFDIVLATIPGWGPDTAPTTLAGWFAQFSENPWLGLRNLDLLNVTVSVVTIAMYLALYGAHRQQQPATALLGLVLVLIGTTLFAAANAALPMLQLSRAYPSAGVADRIALEAAAAGLLARGAHGSMGAFPGFALSELGTLVIAIAMVRGRLFGRVTSWLGVVGAASLIVYSILMTFPTVPASSIVALAVPGGLALIAWQVLVGLGLVRLSLGRPAPLGARRSLGDGRPSVAGA